MKKALLYIPLLILLASCENEVDGPAWPDHDPKLVVTANIRIEGDSVQVFCRVSRTMALEEEFRIDRAMVNDAVVEIHHDGEIHTIPYRTGYYPYDFDVNYAGFLPRSSSGRYELVVRKDAMTARSVLEVPELPLTFDQFKVQWYDPSNRESNVYYRLSTPQNRIRYDLIVEGYYSGPGGGWYVIPFGGRPLIEASYAAYTEGTFRLGYSHPEQERMRYILTAISPQYTAFQDSRWWSGYSGSPFEPEEQNPPFNVGGDGIGFFWWELVGEPVEFSY